MVVYRRCELSQSCGASPVALLISRITIASTKNSPWIRVIKFKCTIKGLCLLWKQHTFWNQRQQNIGQEWVHYSYQGYVEILFLSGIDAKNLTWSAQTWGDHSLRRGGFSYPCWVPTCNQKGTTSPNDIYRLSLVPSNCKLLSRARHHPSKYFFPRWPWRHTEFWLQFSVFKSPPTLVSRAKKRLNFFFWEFLCILPSLTFLRSSVLLTRPINIYSLNHAAPDEKIHCRL
jgi:hypothetical protein